MSQNNWEEVELGSIADVVLGGTPSTAIPEYWIPEIDWVTAKDISETATAKIYKTERMISKLGLEKSPAKVLPPLTTVIIARGATMGKCRMLGRAMALNQTCYGMIAREKYADPIFLYYYLSNLYEYFRAMAHGTVFDTVIGSGLRALKVNLPPIPEQCAIAGVLGALDDKIELNRRMNRTLESMARAVFRRWFVEAEEVEGWKEKGLDDIADFLNGLALQKFPPDGDHYLPVIKIAQLRKNNTSDADKASVSLPPEYIVEDGDVLFSWSGSLEVVIWCGGKGALNQHLFRVTSDKYPKWFYYFWIKHHLPDFQEIAAGKATTMGHIQRHHLREARVLVPSEKDLQEMDKVMSPLLDKLIANSLESRTLASLRDALLPKLMRGEVRVSEL